MLRVVVGLCLVAAAVAGPPVTRSRSEIEKFRDFLESTRTERGVRIGSNPLASAWENSGKFEGDILLDEEQLESLIEQFSSGKAAYIWPNTLWPSRTIPYEFAAGHFDNAQRDYILYTMRLLQERTCIRFRPRNPGEFNYALVTGHANGCYASVGYWASRGVHTMNVARDRPGRGCMNPIVIIHEWLHVIGFFHMQSTYTRDHYVRINWPNIQRGMEHNFERFERNVVSNLGLPYEYDSCMHYGAHAFSTNGRTTIDALRWHNGQMGQTSYVTGLDLWRVDRHYGCYAWRTEKDYQPIHLKDFPEAKEETAPDAKEETAPEAIEETAPEAIEETAPEAKEETAPEAKEVDPVKI